MSNTEMNRRSAIVSSLGLGLGLLSINELAQAQDTQAGESAESKPKKRESRRKKYQTQVWKYVPLNPAPAAQAAYEAYHTHGCMYAAVKAGILAYADAVEASDPAQAETARQFPFDAFKYGRTGYGAQETLCGAVNGVGFFMSLFVENPNDLNVLLKKVTEYVKETPQPQFIPTPDLHPNFVQAISHSVICKENTTAWLAKDPSDEHKKLRSERCMRYTASVLTFAIETLNEFFKENA